MVKIQVEVFWVVMLCSVVVGYQCFRGQSCLQLQGEVTRMAKSDTDIGPEWRGASGAASQQEAGRECSGS